MDLPSSLPQAMIVIDLEQVSMNCDAAVKLGPVETELGLGCSKEFPARRVCKRSAIGLCVFATCASIVAFSIALWSAWRAGKPVDGEKQDDFFEKNLGVLILNNESQHLSGEAVPHIFELMMNASHLRAITASETQRGVNRRLSANKSFPMMFLTEERALEFQIGESENALRVPAQFMLQMEEVPEPSDGKFVLMNDTKAKIDVIWSDQDVNSLNHTSMYRCNKTECDIVKGRRLFWKWVVKPVCDWLCSIIMKPICKIIPAQYVKVKSFSRGAVDDLLCVRSLTELRNERLSVLRSQASRTLPEFRIQVPPTTTTHLTTSDATATNTTNITEPEPMPGDEMLQLENEILQAKAICRSVVNHTSVQVQLENTAALREHLIDVFQQVNFPKSIEDRLISAAKAIPDTPEYVKTFFKMVAPAKRVCHNEPSRTCRNVCWVVRVMTWVARFVSCLPADAPMLTQSGLMPVAEVGLTTPILTSGGLVTSYMDPHMDFSAITRMQYLKAASGHELYLSSQHYLKADGRHRFAQDVTIGMQVEIMFENASKYSTPIVKTGVALKQGLFSPFNAAGDYAIGTGGLEGGIVVSVFSEFLFEGMLPTEIIPAIYAKLFAPLAWIHDHFPGLLVRFNKDMWRKSIASAKAGKPLPAFNELGVVEITKSVCSSLWASVGAWSI